MLKGMPLVKHKFEIHTSSDMIYTIQRMSQSGFRVEYAADLVGWGKLNLIN